MHLQTGSIFELQRDDKKEEETVIYTLNQPKRKSVKTSEQKEKFKAWLKK